MPWEVRIDLVPMRHLRELLEEEEDKFIQTQLRDQPEEAREATLAQFTVAKATVALLANQLQCEKISGTIKGHHNGSKREPGQMGNRLTIDIAEVRLLSNRE